MSNIGKPPYGPFPTVPNNQAGTPQNPNLVQDQQFYSAGYPVHLAKASGLLKRTESILTPAMLVSRHLKGIPLTMPNGDTYSNDDLKDQIVMATSEAEDLCGFTFSREQYSNKVPFDRNLARQYLHIKTQEGPILSVQALSVVSADGYNIYTIPPEWIETSGFAKKIINIIPILGSYALGQGTGGIYSTSLFAVFFSNLHFLPGFWQYDITTGVSKEEGQFPMIINQLIGTIAAMNILSPIAATNILNSQSLSQDGLSQSSSGPGPRIYAERMEELKNKRDELVRKIKTQFSNKFLVSSI
jgi:hypothetical protein